MAPNVGRKRVYRRFEQVEFLPFENLVINISESDESDESDVEVPIQLPALPETETWYTVGEFQVLLDYLPQEHEQYFLLQLVNFIQGTPNLNEPVLPQLEHEEFFIREFFLRGLRFRGEHFTPQQVEVLLDDFSSFFPTRIRENQMQSIQWVVGSDTVEFVREQPRQQQQQQQQEQEQQQHK